MSDPIQEPLERYRQVIEKLEGVARQHGLYLQVAAVVPPREPDGPVMLQAGFLVGEVAVEGAEEEHDSDLDKEFNAIMNGAAKAEEAQKMDEIRGDYDSGKGIFGDE